MQLCANPREVPTSMNKKFLGTVIVFDVCSRRDTMLSHFFPANFRFNAVFYVITLQAVVEP